MILAILQARTSSSRLPGKVLKPILGKEMLLRQIERIQYSNMIDKLVVATSINASDDAIEKMCQDNNIKVFRGDLNNVLDRFCQCARQYNPKYVVRLTGDCPLADWQVIDQTIQYYIKGKYDYVNNRSKPAFPDGLDVEVISYSALKSACDNAVLPLEKEHVTLYVRHRKDKFKLGYYYSAKDLSHMRWTVDEPEDFILVEKIYKNLYKNNPKFLMKDVLELLNNEPELLKINSHIGTSEGLKKSLKEDEEFIKMNYKKSEQLLDRALKSIPLASQTFSKSLTTYPRGVSPFFIEKGKGSKVWDVDGNEYIDFVNSLAAVTLGYCDEDVDKAVQKQMKNGVTFSLPHRLEMEVAEKLIDIIPCAEKVRFAKNGTDATSASIRIARAYTGKKHIAVCGYHGWQDWYIGSTTRDLGVPKAVKDLTHKYEYNNIESLEKIFQEQELACVIMEPMNVLYPKDGFLEKVKKLTHENNALLIFDETVTGFRYSLGGAQELFRITPDLATFGKGMANGYPLSAIVGSNEIMQKVEDIFFSGTFGGETLSLAAANAVIDKHKNHNVIGHFVKIGKYLMKQLQELLDEKDLNDIFIVSGHPSWSFLQIKQQERYTTFEIKTLFLQEVFKRGILTLGSHNISFSHTKEDIDKLIVVYTEVLPMVKQHIDNQTLLENIQAKVLESLFKVR